MQFLGNRLRFFSKISGFKGKVGKTVKQALKFHRNIFIASKITVFTIFYSIFQNYAKNAQSLVTFSVNVVKQFI